MANLCDNYILLLGEKSDVLSNSKAIMNEYEKIAGNTGCNGEVHKIWEISDIRFRFVTAWSPALDYTLNLSINFPKVKIKHKWETVGDGVRGFVVVKNGKVLKECTEFLRYDEETDKEYVVERAYINNERKYNEL